MAFQSYSVANIEEKRKELFVKTYGWMAAALTATALVSLYLATNEDLIIQIFQNRILFWALILGEFGLVIWLSSAIMKLSYEAAISMFLIYAILNGITLSGIFLIYTAGSLASTFFVTAGTFGVMSAYGYLTKRDLSSWGNLLISGLIGIVIASIVNIFLQSSALYWVTTYIGVLIFVGLTAYDTQKIKDMFSNYQEGLNSSSENPSRSFEGKLAIISALTLYLDFINLFLFLLRIMGKRR